MNKSIREFRRSSASDTKSAIADVLRKAGLRVKSSFIEEFAAYTGVSVDSGFFVFPLPTKDVVAIAEFVDWATPEGFKYALRSGERGECHGKVGPLLIFADGPGGDMFAVDAARGTIWLSLHDPDNPFRKVAASFEEFLAKVRYLDPHKDRFDD